jgi:3-hydroxyisobutyrate dehydrogenase
MSTPEKRVFVCLGYGEVGKIFATALADSGAIVRCFDTQFSPQEAGAGLAPIEGDKRIVTGALAEVLSGADIVLSMVTTSVAKDAAIDCAAHLEPGQIFLDLNSTHPDVKRKIGAIIAASGATPLEGAVLGLVGATRAKTRTLLCGQGAANTSELLNAHGFNCEPYAGEFGSASTFKMLRSVFSKGVEAILLETLLAARKAGLEEDVWNEIRATFEQVPFDRMAANWLTSHPGACKRRRDEMVQVEQVLRDLGQPPTMTEATTRIFERSCAQNLDAEFATSPSDYGAVLAALEKGAPANSK